MIVLAVDPGARSGWALSDPSFSGKIDHERTAMEDWWGDKPERGMVTAWAKRLDKTERLKRTLGVYERWLTCLIAYHPTDMMVVERAAPFKRASNSHVLEFRGATLGVAGRLNVAMVECHPAQWRKHLNGRDYDPAKDHHIAAECMLAWWAKQ